MVGIYIKDSHFNLSGNLEIDGAGGDGGSLVTGSKLLTATSISTATCWLKDMEERGRIRFAEGILIKDSDFNVSGKQINWKEEEAQDPKSGMESASSW